MAKKKKLQLKPVARTFATTSMPKKVEAAEDEATGTAEESTTTATSDTKDVSQGPQEEGTTRATLGASSGTGVEEPDELQAIVDKHQDKTQREVMRTIKAIEYDKRFAKTLPSLELDTDLIDEIFVLYEKHGKCFNKTVEGSSEKALTRLGVTFGVLRRLGFSEEVVDQCLRQIAGVELEEAYEWVSKRYTGSLLYSMTDHVKLAMNVPEEDFLAAGTQFSCPIRSMLRCHCFVAPDADTNLSRSNHQSADFESSTGYSTPAREVDTAAKPSAATRASDRTALSAPTKTNAEKGRATLDYSSIDLDDPTAEYVRTKILLTKRDRKLASRDCTDSLSDEELHKRLGACQTHYFFRAKDAETQYRQELKQLNSLKLQAKLHGQTALHSEITHSSSTPALETQAVNIVASPAEDILEAGDDDDGAGFFQILDDLPSQETGPGGTVVTLKNMTVPKHWSGRLPKVFLAEAAAKLDKYAVVTYRIISGASRAKRASVHVLWEGKRQEEWFMEDAACPDDNQAEQYIALAALHSLTFPPSNGFAGGTQTTVHSPTFFRLLPPAYRDLWDELEAKRKVHEDDVNKSAWAKVKDIAEAKWDLAQQNKTKGSESERQNQGSNIKKSRPAKEMHSEDLVQELRVRQESQAYQEMLRYRNGLPIAKYRQEIINTLEQSQILVLSGETGCGKSTQVPSFIMEDQLSRGQPCRIYCTEPRRISAISLAQRVSAELGEAPGSVGTLNSLVGYSIRLESNTTKNTRLAYVTNGIALRMLESGSGSSGQGSAFDEITHIIIDEVHERSIESDFLLIVLKSLISQRPDLRHVIILMSATVDAEKISSFFGGCPTLHVPGRTFPVDVRFLEDSIELTKWSLTEDSAYARRLNDKFYRSKDRAEWSEDVIQREDDDDAQATVKLEKRYSPETTKAINLLDERALPYDLIVRLLERLCFEDPAYRSFSPATLIFMPGLGEIRKMNDILQEHPHFGNESSFRIYPLHSALSTENQTSVFDIPPPGVRKIVIATNIAETGITIPDITCVIDSGKQREMRFDEKRQISRLIETFVAKSNAAQRRGRAGRVQNGLCFHLFTRIRHDTMLADHPLPEMMRLSLSDLALRIKIMKVKIGTSIEDVLSRAMDPPSSINIQRAVSALVEVRALTLSEEITPLGRLLSKLPTDVHLGKFLLTSVVLRCLDPALTIAAALSSKSPFVTPFGLEQEADRAKMTFRVGDSDFLTIHNAFASWRRATGNHGYARTFCRKHYLSQQNLQQIEELRQQFLGYLIDSSFLQVDKAFVKELTRARSTRCLVTIPPVLDENSLDPAFVHAALTAGLYPKLLALDPTNQQMRTISNNQMVSAHPSSINFGRKAIDFGVNHLTYFTLMHSRKLYAWETAPVDDLAILLFCGDCDFKLIANSAFVDRKIRFQLTPRANVALKILRTHLADVLSQQFRCRPLTESQTVWQCVAMKALAKMKEDIP
ncbi:P-loop containing nucleoside triphosphate hydrolase protein [Coniophora puteana RWD-64-598 SS2]|uniref:RNA helicase n=1 Tax=Coniophora puteana (strain RWD-64-598) TaxID=741705 RepID=A0A5M3N696_CONPW|nr:P-loop containing nucleoside triphosphate hydrolase protein [Coniophora puteana RWD-64-598 SS2]EIW86594.1 P-loop containing nucleoside triphosphate hydrolase protein [Coniophora puteana RWD-64-598 SS2]